MDQVINLPEYSGFRMNLKLPLSQVAIQDNVHNIAKPWLEILRVLSTISFLLIGFPLSHINLGFFLSSGVLMKSYFYWHSLVFLSYPNRFSFLWWVSKLIFRFFWNPVFSEIPFFSEGGVFVLDEFPNSYHFEVLFDVSGFTSYACFSKLSLLLSLKSCQGEPLFAFPDSFYYMIYDI